jgi:sialate O-acetylesterase
MKEPFTLGSMFTDHMVLQQRVTVPVWGTGPEDGKVTVQLQGQMVSAVVHEGNWSLHLAPLVAGGPYEMQFWLERAQPFEVEEITFNDVLVGEVWLAGGQSNMVQQLLFTEGGLEAAKHADNSCIRFYTTPRRPYPEARVPGWSFIGTISEDEAWQRCTPETAIHFSAIAYHYAELLQLARQVPVGIISCNWGGTPIQAWMSEKHLDRDPELRHLLNKYEQFVGTLDQDRYELEEADYNRNMFRMIAERGNIEQRVKDLGMEGYRRWVADNPLNWPPQPWGPKAPERPSGLYHSMLESVIPFAIRGVLWYQGESNAVAEEAGLYRAMLTRLIENWRELWGELELSFLIVQLTSFAPAHDPNGQNWAVIREAQAVVAHQVSQTALVVTIDCGERQDIHPIAKRPIAERLVLAARALAYGENIPYQAPYYKSMTIEESSIILTFEGVTEGWEPQKEPLTGFVICGEDRLFIQAEARILDDRIEVYCPEIADPVAVRYAWANMPQFSLRDRHGFLASPFRTDQFELQLT